jgi:hypothetical protein
MSSFFADPGAPTGVSTNAFLSNDQVAKLIDDPRTWGVTLTWFREGRRIYGVPCRQELEEIDHGTARKR